MADGLPNQNKRPSLKLLRVFEAAGRHLSFKAAAEELCVSPPAVSHQIKVLEEQLGIPLFKRLNRALALTDAGREYFTDISVALNTINTSTDRLIRKHTQTTLRISCMPFIASEIIVPNLHEFQAIAPKLVIELETPKQFVDLYKDNIDLGIRYGNGDWPNVEVTKLTDLICTPVCSVDAAKLLAAKGKAGLSDCTVYLLKGGDEALWTSWGELSGIHMDRLTKRVYLDSYQAVLSATERSCGIAMGALPLMASYLENEKLSLPFADIYLKISGIYAISPIDCEDNSAQKGFIEWLLRHLQQLQATSDKFFLSEFR